jgi:hypothetical protein
MTTKRRSPEHDQQTAFFRWVRMRLPQYRRVIFAVPNGGLRDVRTAARLRAEGVTPGVWDIMCCIPHGGHPGCCIEMKSGKNKLTYDQQEFCFDMNVNGWHMVGPCYSWTTAANGLLEYLGCKERV